MNVRLYRALLARWFIVFVIGPLGFENRCPALRGRHPAASLINCKQRESQRRASMWPLALAGTQQPSHAPITTGPLPDSIASGNERGRGNSHHEVARAAVTRAGGH